MINIPNNLGDVQCDVLAWILEDEGVGLSSRCMALWLAFNKKVPERDHPHDPADFDRCLRLLDRAPGLRQHLSKMAEVSQLWARLIEHWDEIERCHLEEVGLGWTKARRAPKTYELMQSVLDGKRRKQSEAAP